MTPGVRSREGLFTIDGEDRLLLIGDYPYYRDDAREWAKRLAMIAETGLDVVSCYVPWRHHEVEGVLDFEGHTQANRNLLRFLDLCGQNALQVVLKPGPFVHAELAYGGLPDDVEPGSGIEPEVDAHGHPLVWPTGHARVAPRALPAPFDPAFLRRAEGWFEALARRVVAGRAWPEGPIIALQLMNEGIYSDSSAAGPTQMGFSRSTLARYHAFLASRGLPASDPPRVVDLLREPTDVLPYLDWSAFQATLYDAAATEYAKSLHRDGLRRELPIVFNFNPNIETYRTNPASNDGWYTRVNLNETEFTFGTTNWVGVVAGDAQAFRQYVMALTAFRGPCMEQNWGYSSQYYAPYEFVTPSHFESMLGLACGATGIGVYPVVSTRAWRHDAHLGDLFTAERTNERGDDTGGDYPGSAAILSNGERTPKFWTLMQMASYLRSEGPRFVRHGPLAPIAWGIYAPYAWVGQWLPRGDPDDILWRPPLQAIPRGAYHGLDAFVEMMTHAGIAFRQVDLARDTTALERTRILCISGHEFMAQDAQERLASWVERGGRLLLTNFVADKDERMRPMQGALAERLFPHRVVRRVGVASPEPLLLDGLDVGRALEFAFHVEPPTDAEAILVLRGECVGYQRAVGAGRVLFAGVGPWRAVHSGDDHALARQNQALTRALLRRLGAEELDVARPARSYGGEVLVWQHGDPSIDEQHVFVVVREMNGEVRVRLSRPGGRAIEVALDSPSQSVHAFSLADGRLRACYLKGTNDLRGERVRPRLSTPAETWDASASCDLCVFPEGNAVLVSAAHLPAEVDAARVRLGPDAVDIARIEQAGFVRVARRGPSAPDAAGRRSGGR